jgi:hypothetical protein
LKSIYFCVYRITNIAEKKHYYGYKSSIIHPSKVIGITYFSSLTKEEGIAFRKDQKENPQNYKYKIVQLFDTKEEALNREIKLHKKFNVKTHPNFYNKANQTSTGFDTTGTSYESLESRLKKSIRMITDNKNRDMSGENNPMFGSHRTGADNPFYGKTHSQKTRDLISIAGTGCKPDEESRNKMSTAAKGKQTFRYLSDGTFGRTSVDDPRWKTGEICSITSKVYELTSPSGKIIVTGDIKNTMNSMNLSWCWPLRKSHDNEFSLVFQPKSKQNKIPANGWRIKRIYL